MPHILGTRVDPTSYAEASSNIVDWALRREGRAVAAATVHMLVEAHDHPEFRQGLHAFDLVAPDGMPLVWRLRALGLPGQQRVYGPDLMLHVCAKAEAAGVPIGIFGGSPPALDGTVAMLTRRYPTLKIKYAFSPPVREGDHTEDASVLARIRCSGIGILFVALGCPKQERWIARHRRLLPMVLIAVGAAIDFHSGRVRQAPGWMQSAGLEWLFRLAMDPRRLAARYFYTSSKYLYLWLFRRG